jgi:hypothetical protein
MVRFEGEELILKRRQQTAVGCSNRWLYTLDSRDGGCSDIGGRSDRRPA